MLQDLRKENAALKEQMATFESISEEKQKILKALQSERTIQKQAQKDYKSNEKDEEIHLLKPSLAEAKTETLSVKHHWSAEFRRLSAHWERLNQLISKNWENHWAAQQLKIKMKIESVKRDCERSHPGKGQSHQENNKRKEGS